MYVLGMKFSEGTVVNRHMASTGSLAKTRDMLSLRYKDHLVS